MAKEQKLRDILKAHSDNQDKIGDSSAKAMHRVREMIHNKSKNKKTDINEQINKLLAKEAENLQELANTENQSNLELQRLSMQFEDKCKTGTYLDPSDTIRNQDVRTQTLNNIWNDSVQDIDRILDLQKERVKLLTGNLMNEKDSQSAQALKLRAMNANTTQEQITKNSIEFLKKLDDIRKDIKKTENEIEENNRLEKEKIVKAMLKSHKFAAEQIPKMNKKFLENYKKQ